MTHALRLTLLCVAVSAPVLAPSPARAQESLEELLVKADERFDAQDYKGAIEAYTAALALQPDHTGALVWRGRAKLALGDAKGCADDATRAIELDPRDPDAFGVRAEAKADLGDLPGALADYDRLLSLVSKDDEEQRPYYVAQLVRRGNVRLELGDLDGAVADGDAAAAIDEAFPDLYWMRGRAQALRGDTGRAVSDMRRMAQLSEDFPYAHIMIAAWTGEASALMAYTSQEGWVGALARYLRGELDDQELLAAANVAPDERARLDQQCEAYGYLGMVAERTGRLDQARAYYRSCVDTKVKNFVEYHHAVQRLKRLESGPPARPCVSCGTDRPPEKGFCPGCGTAR